MKLRRIFLVFIVVCVISILLFISCTPKESLIGATMVSYCPYSNDKMYCYRDAAVQSADPKLCDKIDDSYGSDAAQVRVKCLKMVDLVISE